MPKFKSELKPGVLHPYGPDPVSPAISKPFPECGVFRICVFFSNSRPNGAVYRTRCPDKQLVTDPCEPTGINAKMDTEMIVLKMSPLRHKV